MKKIILGLAFITFLTGCSTTVVLVDTTASTVIHTAKATVNTAPNIVDAITLQTF